MVNIEKIKVNVGGKDHITNSYILYDDSKEAVIFDPADEQEKIIDKVKELELDVKYIVITHAHADHFGALEKIAKWTNAYILVHENDYEALVNKAPNYAEELGVRKQNLESFTIVKIFDGYNFKIGNINLEVIHTPGHTDGGICIFEKTSNSLFTGDTIFCNCYGRCDLYSASSEKMVESLKKIFSRFEDVTIYSGHDKSVKIEESKKYIKMLMSIKGIKL